MGKDLKISELSKRTGVARSTILYYVKMGLLPAPRKTSPNMAWYDESCAERLMFIKELQRRKFIPLEHIKHLLDNTESSHLPAQRLVEAHRMLFEYRPPDEPSLTRKQILRRTGLSDVELAQAERMKLVIPSGEGAKPYDEDDVQQGRALKKLIRLGVSIERISYYPELVAQFVSEDLQLHDEVTKEYHKSDPEKFLNNTEIMISAGRKSREYLFLKIFQIAVREKMKQEIVEGSCLACPEEREENK